MGAGDFNVGALVYTNSQWDALEAELDRALRDVETVGEDLDAANADRKILADALTATKAWLLQEEEVGLGVPDILWDIIIAAIKDTP